MGARERSVLLAADLLPRCFPKRERIFATYNEAIAIKVREGAPLATYSIDRRCLRKYAEATSGDQIEAPISFLCACMCPRGSAFARNPIEWRRPKLHQNLLFFSGEKTTQSLFSCDSFLGKYGKYPLGHFDLSRCPKEFDVWWIDVLFGDTYVRLLCCPEDQTCNRPGCLTRPELCSECQVPCAVLAGNRLAETSPSFLQRRWPTT
jgi:hypothetical protein